MKSMPNLNLKAKAVGKAGVYKITPKKAVSSQAKVVVKTQVVQQGKLKQSATETAAASVEQSK